MGREHASSNSKVPCNNNNVVYNVGAPSSSQGSVTGVSSYCGDDDDIYSDLDTDLDNIACPAPSSSLSMVMGEASDDDDIVFPKFNSPLTLWPCDDAQKFYMKLINEHLTGFLQCKVDELCCIPRSSDDFSQPDNHEGNCQSSQSNCPSEMANTFGTIAGESIPNLPDKDSDKEDAVQSLPLSMHRDEKSELSNQKLKCGSSQTNCTYNTEKPFSNAFSDALASASKSDGMIAGKSIYNFAEKDINKGKAQPGSPLSIRRDKKLEPRIYEGECQSSQSNCSSKTTKPLEDTLVSNSNRTIAGNSISNLLEKDINEEDILSSSPPSTCRDEKLECNSNKRKGQRSQRSYPSEMAKTFEGTLVSNFDEATASQSVCIIEKDALPDEELQPDNHRRKCQGSQTNYPSKMMKPFDTTDLNSNEMVLSESISNFLETGMIKEIDVPDSAPSKHEDEKLEPDNHKRKYQSSQSNYNYPSKTKKTFDYMPASNSDVMITIESISNFPEKDTDEEDAVQNLSLSMHRDEKLELNNYKLKCGSSQTNCPYKTAKPFSDALASKSDGMIAGKSISNFAEKDIDKENSQPDGKLEPRNYEGECQNSQSNYSCKTTKSLEDTLVLNSNSTIAGKSISNLPEKEINEEDVLSSALLSTCRDEKIEPINHKRKCQSYRSNCSSQTTKPVDNMLVPDSNGMFAGSISSLPEKNINEQDALPDEKLEPDNHKRKYQSSQSNYSYKTKKTFDNMPTSSSDVMITRENISNFTEEGSDEEIAVPGSSLSLSGVKLRIKSFTVPEFFVEIPETATISFLKRKIMEKANAIVGGAHVGVLLQGKKIRDENKTLSETDISNESRLDVILESIPSQAPHSCPPQLPCDLSQPLTRDNNFGGTSDTSPDPLLCNSGNVIQGDHDLVESQTNMLIGKSITSTEVTALPAMSVEPQVVAPVHQKSNSSKNVQRRNSEFFSISEVEALVQAVEKLGTGRWKKIKEQAFGYASNRTHTDLKDKWRSLLNTAKIPANKRRAVVLPQELLDRVLAVETHNSLQQGMQQ